MAPIIQVTGLSKTYGAVAAVNDLSFDIFPGDIYGFLGQNGAGKSTTMRMLLGLVIPDNGSIYIKGEPFSNTNRHLLKHIGAIIEKPDMYGYLSGLDNIRLFSRLSGLKPNSARISELLSLVSLTGREKDKVKTYSQGMKQRLGIAIALIHNPEILILDEPTNGLDPQGIADMRKLILHLSRDHGKTIIISSHLLFEVEQLANRMLILNKGQKMVEGEVADLLKPSDTLIEINLAPDPAVIEQIKFNATWSKNLKDIQTESLLFKINPDYVPALTRFLVDSGAAIYSIRIRHSLEAYFLSLTNDSNHVALASN